jgi:hypothetical protein
VKEVWLPLLGVTVAMTPLRADPVDAGSFKWTFTNGAGISGNLLLKGKFKTLTLSSCPAGLEAGNFIYISQGFGVSESVVITASSCPPERPGTVTVATRHSHLGKWTAGTSTAGIQEAVAVSGSKTAEVLLGPGTFEVHSRITLRSNITLRGAGIDTTTIVVPRNEFTNSAPWQFGLNPSGTVIFGPPGHSAITVTGLTVKFSSQSQAPNDSYGIVLVDVNHSLIEAVAVRDGPILRKGNTFLPIAVLGLSSNNTVQDSSVYNRPCPISSEGSGGFIATGSSNRFLHNYVSNGCNSSYVTSGSNTLFEGNVFELANSTMLPQAQAFAADNASGARFVNNRCIGNGTAPACFSAVTDARKPDTRDSTFIGNEARNCGQGLQFQSTVGHSRGIRVEKGAVINCKEPLSLMGIIDDVSIAGVAGVRELRSARIVSIPVNRQFLHDVPTVGADVIWMTGAAGDYAVGGFKEGSVERRLQVVNAAGHVMTFTGNDPKSKGENGICSEAVSPPESFITLVYNASLRCWAVSGAIAHL